MAWVDGEDQKTSSIGRSLARHKMSKMPKEEMGEGGGKEMMMKEMPGGGMHSHAKMNAMDKGVHMDHPNMEHAMEHMKAHFGHGMEKKEMSEKQMEGEDEGHMM